MTRKYVFEVVTNDDESQSCKMYTNHSEAASVFDLITICGACIRMVEHGSPNAVERVWARRVFEALGISGRLTVEIENMRRE
jgi:hypothetical protein